MRPACFSPGLDSHFDVTSRGSTASLFIPKHTYVPRVGTIAILLYHFEMNSYKHLLPPTVIRLCWVIISCIER